MHRQLVPEPIRLTYQDYCALPDDGKRYEVLDGGLRVSPSPTTKHQRVVFLLSRLLAHHVEREKLGEILVAPLDVVLGPNDVVQPDVVYVSQANASIITDDNIQGAPDLVIDVIARSNPQLDTRDQRQVYSRCGIPFYWIVDPWRQTLLELQRVEKDYAEVTCCHAGDRLTPQLYPDLVIEVDTLWTPTR
ncbi:MAG: Uma2 family endonuclease [Phycisphaerae bacterium]